MALLIAQVQPLNPVHVALAEVLGLVLAEEINSPIDSPPFDKALMDGYAVRAADVNSGPAQLAVIEEITAGRRASRPLGPQQAIRIMTGAPIPEGADAVVRLEDTRFDAAGSRVEIRRTCRCSGGQPHAARLVDEAWRAFGSGRKNTKTAGNGSFGGNREINAPCLSPAASGHPRHGG